MPNFPLYHCPCHPLLPPYLPSSLPALHPLDALYFCDACDAIRCARCVQLEVASYFCPGCLFEVPSASVRAERNRCARNCFQCPACPAALHVVPSDPPRPPPPPPDSSASSSAGQAPYYLECRACGWNSSSIDLSFDKPVGLAHQVLGQEKTSAETRETDRLQSHFDHYLHRLTQALERQHLLAPAAVGAAGAGRLAKKSLAGKAFTNSRRRAPLPFRASPGGTTSDRDGPGPAAKVLVPGSPLGVGTARPSPSPTTTGTATAFPLAILPAPISEDPVPYRAKNRWADAVRARGREGTTVESVFEDPEIGTEDGARPVGRERGMVRDMMAFQGQGGDGGFAGIEQLWDQPWAHYSRLSSNQRPTRLPLLAKRTLRCPTCTHTLIRPESKPHSTRYKIKVVAMNYLPGVEVGARRVLGTTAEGQWRDSAKKDQGRREKLENRLGPGNVYAFQLALTNPLLESISVALTPGHTSLHGLTPTPADLFEVWFPLQVVPVGAFGEAPAEAPAQEGGEWVEVGESVSKVTFYIAVHEALRRYIKPGRSLELQFDLNLEFTYTVEEEYTPDVGKAAERRGTTSAREKEAVPQVRKVEKTFRFDTRVTVGTVAGE
ncbi:hypothetical protein NCC49_005077 [Naganishia albida]|nr:hypothetical protein NCC49_005077 [Naganishia albida]